MQTPYEFHNNQLGIKTKFLISDQNKVENSLCKLTYRSLKKRCDSNTCTEVQLRSGSWSYESLVLFSSLDQIWKDELTTRFGKPETQIKKSWFETHYVADRDAFDFYNSYTYGNNKKLSLDLIELYTLQASALNTVLEIKANRKAYAKALGCKRLDIWQSLNLDVNAFRLTEHKLPTNKDSLRRKALRYQKEGYESIVSGKLQNNNASKITKKEQFAVIDELIAKHTNLDSELIATIYNAIAAQQGWAKVTRQTIANRKTSSNLITFAGRNGTKALKSKMLMQHKRSAPSKPMLYWTLDGWDSELLYQAVVYDAKGHKRTTYHNRMTIVVILDPFNKYPIGYAIGENENPQLIKQALQNAFNHTKELLGGYFKPYQMQSDNYSIKKLAPLYKACTSVFTPAAVGNAKAKVIEPYFGYINKKYCKLYDNWSGFNVDSGSKSQPNDEMLNKLRHSFPDQAGAIRQLERIIDTERSIKHEAFIENFANVSIEHKSEMQLDEYLYLFGSTPNKTTKLRGEGVRMILDGVAHFYDTFNLEFRKHLDLNWQLHYDSQNLDNVLASSECGVHRYLLNKKHIEPMAIADRKPEDDNKGAKIDQFNKSVINHITATRKTNTETVDSFFAENPKLNDTLAKHLLVDSKGQHKEPKQALKSVSKTTIDITPVVKKKESPDQEAYYSSRVNIDDYI